MRARIIAVAAALLLLAALVGINLQSRPPGQTAAPQPDSPATTAPPVATGPPALSIDVTAVGQHLAALEQIAQTNGGTRAAGSPGYDASLDYVERVLQSAGYETERQPVEITYEGVLEASIELVGYPTPLLRPLRGSPPTPATGATGEVATPSDGTGCVATAYAARAGFVAVAERGACTFAEKSRAAAEAGAGALLIISTTDRALAGTGGEGDGLVPTLAIGFDDGQRLLALTGETATVTYRSVVEQRTTYNLIAQTPAQSADDVVMIGAHLDSAAAGPGINDNGSGAATVLELAVQLADAGPLVTPVRFAWWTAEEIGLIGSQHYVASLSATELSEIALYINADMLGSHNYMIAVYDAAGSVPVVGSRTGHESAAAQALLADYFDGQGQPWIPVELAGSSDHAPFAEAGVPIAGLYTGSSEVKSAEEAVLFGGTAGVPYDEGYHTPDDVLDRISPAALQITGDALAHLLSALSYDVGLLRR